MNLYLRIAAWAVLATALLAGLNWWTSSIERRGYERGRAEVQAMRVQDQRDRALEDTARTRAGLRQSEVNRDEEARREAAKHKEITNAQETARLARAAAARADRTADGLRDDLATRLAADTARAREGAADPAARERSEATAAALVLYADLYRSADHRAGELAKALDVSRAAGITAERSYDSLSP